MPFMAERPKRITPGELTAEGGERFVDVGALHLDPHGLASVHVERELVDVVEVSAQHGGHKFEPIVGF